MNKILLCLALAIGLSANVIELTGETASKYGNPFKSIFGERTSTMNIYSETKDIILDVEVLGVNNNDMFNTALVYPKQFTLKNGSVTNVTRLFFEEDYKVNINKGGVEVNVLKGKVFLTFDEVQNTYLLQKTEVELLIEIISNGVKQEKKVRLDHNLNMKKRDNFLIVHTNMMSNIKIENINEIVSKIIETNIYNSLKEEK